MDNNNDEPKYHATLFFEREGERFFQLESQGTLEKKQMTSANFKFADWYVYDFNGETPDINGDIGKCLDLVPYILDSAASVVRSLPPSQKSRQPVAIVTLNDGNFSFGLQVQCENYEGELYEVV